MDPCATWVSAWGAVDSMCERRAMGSNSWKVYAWARGVRWGRDGVLRAQRSRVSLRILTVRGKVIYAPCMFTAKQTTLWSNGYGRKVKHKDWLAGKLLTFSALLTRFTYLPICYEINFSAPMCHAVKTRVSTRFLIIT